MLFEQSRTELEKRLVVALSQLLEDQQTRCFPKGAEKNAKLLVELNAHAA